MGNLKLGFLVVVSLLDLNHYYVVSQNLGHFCNEADEIEEIRSEDCSLNNEMAGKGFLLDGKLTDLRRFKGNDDYDTCIFIRRKNKICCDGWKGLNCDEAICTNECLNKGVCDSPNHCNCKDTNHCGPTCNFSADDFGSQAYCFTDGKCQSTMSPSDLMSPLECCYLRNGVSYKQCARDECLTCRGAQYSYPPVDSKFSGTTGASSTCSGSNGFTKTFDGLMFIYEACCSYVLLRNGLETVVMEMAGCESNAQGHIGLSVELADNRKIFLSASEVKINGRQVKVQPGYAEGALKITQNGIYHVLEYGRLKCGVSDDLWFVKYEVKEDKKVTGICGNKNNDHKDDFMNMKSMAEFMNHWKADPFQKCKEAKQVTFDETSNEEMKKKIVQACIFLQSFPFSKCHGKVDVRLLYDKCLSEYCTKSVKNKTEVVEVTCRLGAEYAAECARKGVLLEWRSKGFCYKPCSNPDMVYTELTSQCDPSCSNALGIEPCPHDEKYPGCKCKPGLLQEGDKCYKPKDCPCVFDGILYEAGQAVKKDCNNCTCTFGSWACTKIGCPKTCSVFGLNQVITFDGFSYSHNGPSCEYILVQHTGSINDEENFLRITVETETLGNPNSIFTKPKLVKLMLRKLHKSTTVEVRLSSGRSWVTLDGVSISEERQPIKNDLVFVLITDWQVVVQGVNEQLKVEVFGGIDVRLGEAYMSQVSGLCGNWNNKADDELRSSSGIVESSTSFSMSFSDCDTRLFPRVAPHDPCMGQTDTTMMLQKLCKAFNDDDKCSRSKQTVDYEEICLKHQCAELLSPAAASTDASFDKKFLYYGIRKVMECINQGHVDVDYIVNDPAANTTFFCPPGLMFHICGSPVKSCRQLSTYSTYENFHLLGKTCFPGCLCSDGKLLDENGECVSASKCPCYGDKGGKTYNDGDEIVKDCVTRQCKQGKWLDSPVPQTAVCGTGFNHYDMRQDCNTTCENFDKCWSAKTICDGCVCPEGKVIDENGKCIFPEDCPCLHDNKHYKPGETVDTKSTHCTCVVRRWVCEDKDDYKPSCTLSGDVYVTRFDGVHETNPGLNSCAYVLVASDDSLLKVDGCVELSITAYNLPCGQSGIICAKVISVEYDSKKVVLTRGKHPTVDGEEVNLDSGFHKSPFVTITYNQVMTLLLFNNRLSILYDGATRVYINLPNCYKHYVDGLCGRFGDELKSGDLGGISTWKDDPTCPESSSYKIPKCEDDTKLSWATATCSIITNGKMFEKCRMVVDYQAYHSNCIASTCSCQVGRDCECTCTAVSNFAKACASHNICVHWRSNELCPIMCPEGQHYEPCGDPVSQSCYGNLTKDQLSLNDEEMNVEGCYCSDGQLLNSNGTCVEKASCNCVHEGITYASSASILIDCRNCVCREGKFQCEGESCQKCEDDEFQCEGPNMKTVCRNQLLKCDGNEDCIDGADEKNCSNVCDKTSNFFCGPMNECLPPSFICDGQVDCLDAKDEANCNNCREDMTRCNLSGKCLPAQFKCDGSFDCLVFDINDRSDEEGCFKDKISTALPRTDSGTFPTLLPKLVPKTRSSTEDHTTSPLQPAPPTVHPTVPPTGLPTVPSKFPPVAPPTGLPPAPPTVHPTVPPTGFPTVPSKFPPVAPPTGLPPAPPTVHPTAPPTVHPTVPPTVHPTAPPTVHPTAPPTVHPTAPPTVHPTIPPTAPSKVPRTAPTIALPTTSLKSALTTYKKAEYTTEQLQQTTSTKKNVKNITSDDKLKHCKPIKLLENGRVKFSKLSGNSRMLRKQRLIFNLTEKHYAVYLTLDLSDATEVSMSTNNRTHKGTFLHLSRNYLGNGVMHYFAYPMYLVDALSINFTSNLGFDGLLKVEMGVCHPAMNQTTERPYKNTGKQTVTLGPYKPTSPKSKTCEPFDLMESKNSSLLTVNYTKGSGFKSAELLHFQLKGTFIIHSIYLELHEADMISMQVTDAAGKIIPIKFLRELHAKHPKTNILSAFINSRVDHILLELRAKEGDWKTKVIKILGCPLPQKTDIPLPSTKVYKPSFSGTSRSTRAHEISKPYPLYSTGPNTARTSTHVTEPKTSETSQPVSTARTITTCQPLELMRNFEEYFDDINVTAIDSHHLHAKKTLYLSTIELVVTQDVTASVFISNKTHDMIPVPFVKHINGSLIIWTATVNSKVDDILLNTPFHPEWRLSIMGCPFKDSFTTNLPTRTAIGTSTHVTTDTSQHFSTSPAATSTGTPCPFDIVEDQQFIAKYDIFPSNQFSITHEVKLKSTFDISVIYLKLYSDASAFIFISNASDSNVPMKLVRGENSTKDYNIFITRPETRVDIISLVFHSNDPWSWKVMGCPASARVSLFTSSTTSKLILPETFNPRKVQMDTTFATFSPSTEYKTTQQASTERIPKTTPDEIIQKLKPPCNPQRLIKNGRAKFGKLSAAAQTMRNQRVNLLFTETHFVVYLSIKFMNASGISLSFTNETHRGTFLNLTEYVDDDGVVHLTGYPMFAVDYISINFTSEAGFESLTMMEVSGCRHEKQQTSLKPHEPTAPGASGHAEDFPSTAKPIRHATIPSISMAPCQPFDLMEDYENFESMNFSIKNKDPLTIEYELKLNGTFVINFIYLEIIHAESVSVLFSNATHSNVPLLLVTNEDFGPNKYLLISKPASRVDNMTLILTLKDGDWNVEVVQVMGCPQVSKTTTPPVTTPGPEFPGATLPLSEKGPKSTRQPTEELKKCIISGFIDWNVCYVEKDSTAGVSRKDEECRTGDLVDSGVGVSFDCLYCLCTNGIFYCQEKIGEFRVNFYSCTVLNCTVEGDAVVQNPDPCSCPGEAPKPLSPPKCACNCPPKETPTAPRSTIGQTPTSSTTETSEVCPTTAPTNMAPTQQKPCALVTVNYTFAEVVPEGCFRDEIIQVKTCAGTCQTHFKAAFDAPGLVTLDTLPSSCCQHIELVKKQVTVPCPEFDVNILVTEAASCDCIP